MDSLPAWMAKHSLVQWRSNLRNAIKAFGEGIQYGKSQSLTCGRSPHKLKGGVSGCVRECAEAQSKDFGLIASDKGWNGTRKIFVFLTSWILTSLVFIAGNGGTKPRHATLFATDVPPTKVVRIIDRYLMFYIRTADKLMRTARWVESFEGGVEVCASFAAISAITYTNIIETEKNPSRR
jgi:sulfite reductase beta subunit-like hemoprotein